MFSISNTMKDPIISPEELHAILKSKNTIVLDCRVGENAFLSYQTGHIPGAVYVSLDEDLASVPSDPKVGGRHPLPAFNEFLATVSKWGITTDSTVVLYDTLGGSNAAARCWWMLKSTGVSEAYVLDGGLKSWESSGFELSSGIEKNEQKPILNTKDWLWPTISLSELKEELKNSSIKLIDVRDRERFQGIKEPIDPVSGHIPGAINIPLRDFLTNQGTFKSPEDLRKHFEDSLGDSTQVIFQCGSGVTACQGILAWERAGLNQPILYVGSFSEWCRNEEIAIEGI